MPFNRSAARLVFFAFFLSSPIFAFSLRDIPRLSGPVIDEAGFFSLEEVAALENLAQSFLPQVQIQVWTVKTLEGEAIESRSIRAVEQWKLGTEKKDNGILILIAKTERRMRIEIGQGLEGNVPDALAGRIIDQILKPAFRSGNFFEGLQAAEKYIYQKATGANPPDLDEARPQTSEGQHLNGFIVFGIFLLFIILSSFGRRGGGMGWGAGGWSSGGGGWSGGGGSGWSGGGGGFSGGGASGDW